MYRMGQAGRRECLSILFPAPYVDSFCSCAFDKCIKKKKRGRTATARHTLGG